jgi:hypothetical protein
MKPKETRWKSAGPDSGFVESIHNRAVATAVARHDESEAAAGFHKHLPEPSVLLPKFIGGVLEPPRTKVAV